MQSLTEAARASFKDATIHTIFARKNPNFYHSKMDYHYTSKKMES
jgi:hypothetical protein